jgi:hypothetical protein
MFFKDWRNSTQVGPQEVYQQNSFNINGFNRPNRQAKLHNRMRSYNHRPGHMTMGQARPPGGFAGTIGETFSTLLNDNPNLPNAKIRVMNTTRLGPGWTTDII